MTHYSRLSKIVIDAPEPVHEAEVAFWGEALGVPFVRFERFPEYHGADLEPTGLGILLQHLGDGEARVHLDIHTSDRAAEVARLTGLGATMAHDGEHWAIMRDPAGLLFCVIPDPDVTASNGRAWS